MTDERQNLLWRREILAAYMEVLDRPGELFAMTTSLEGDTDRLRRVVQDTFALSAVAADAVIAMQIKRFTPNEREKTRGELADVDLRIERIDGS
ncbi:hypothetical protein [Microbacterium sp. SS28]|uniref:hypothetical protein n=1 Tax=Microbacterium sp. SS28 TaxID=2919948 RepID=UPI001FAADFC7|nr:hypothetical protein [Microbacterium sp. SS28]